MHLSLHSKLGHCTTRVAFIWEPSRSDLLLSRPTPAVRAPLLELPTGRPQNNGGAVGQAGYSVIETAHTHVDLRHGTGAFLLHQGYAVR